WSSGLTSPAAPPVGSSATATPTASPSEPCPSQLARPASEGVEAAGVDELARQDMADDLFGHPPDLDQRVEIDAGVDPHLLTEQPQLLGAEVAGRSLLPGERAAAEPADRRIELGDPHLETGMGVGDGEPAGVVQMECDRRLGPAATHLAQHPLDPQR